MIVFYNEKIVILEPKVLGWHTKISKAGCLVAYFFNLINRYQPT